MRFSIAYGRTRGLLTLLGMPQKAAYVDVSPTEITVKMGWAFSATIPRTSIQAVRLLDKKVISIGVHGWRGKWLVNGAGDRLVEIEIDPGAPARSVFFPIKLTRLTMSIDDREGLVEALA